MAGSGGFLLTLVSQGLDVAQISRGLNVVCLFNGILFSLKGERTAQLYLHHVSKVARTEETVKKVLLPRTGAGDCSMETEIVGGMNMCWLSLTLPLTVNTTMLHSNKH